jgi:hypothetical protein
MLRLQEKFKFRFFYKSKKSPDGRQGDCKKCAKKRLKIYRIEHGKELTKKRLEWRKRNPNNKEKDRQSHKKWKLKNSDAYRASYQHYNQKRRQKLLSLIGGANPQCIRCGCNFHSILEVNHKDGGGAKEMRELFGGSTARFYCAIISGKRKADDLELLCKPCNAIHYLEMKYGKLPFLVKWINE